MPICLYSMSDSRATTNSQSGVLTTPLIYWKTDLNLERYSRASKPTTCLRKVGTALFYEPTPYLALL
nr:hypothetical protein Q903MT_gene1297 [Picea sitchensis]